MFKKTCIEKIVKYRNTTPRMTSATFHVMQTNICSLSSHDYCGQQWFADLQMWQNAPVWTKMKLWNTKDILKNIRKFKKTTCVYPTFSSMPVVTWLVVKVLNVTSWTIVSLLPFHCDLVVACSFLPLRQYPCLDHRSYPDPCSDPLTDNHRSSCWAPEYLKKSHA